jgi:hypothetical protein
VMIPNLLGLIAMILISRHSDHTTERRYHMAASGCLRWNCDVTAWNSSLSLLLYCPFFSRGNGGIQLLARFLFDAGRIPDRLLSRCGNCADDVRCQLRRIRGAVYRRHHSTTDWQLALRPDLRGNFLPCLSDLGASFAQAGPACSRSSIWGGRRSLRSRYLEQYRRNHDIHCQTDSH